MEKKFAFEMGRERGEETRKKKKNGERERERERGGGRDSMDSL